MTKILLEIVTWLNTIVILVSFCGPFYLLGKYRARNIRINGLKIDTNEYEFNFNSVIKTLFIISALPLILYPMVAIANIMSFDAVGIVDDIGFIKSGLMVAFWGSYPITYYICAYLFIARKTTKTYVAILPLIHELAIIANLSGLILMSK